MEAYFKKPGVRLFLGNVIDVLRQLPEESVDLFNLIMNKLTCGCLIYLTFNISRRY